MGFQQRSAQFVVKADHLIEEFGVLDVVALLVAIVGEGACYHLLVCDVLEVKEIALILI